MSGEIKWSEIKKMDGSCNERGSFDPNRSSEPYLFDMDENGFPVFSDKNIALVTNMIENDSRYNQSDEAELECIFKGMVESKTAEERLECIIRAVCEIDAVNSTHLSTVGRKWKITKLMEKTGEHPMQMGKREIAGGQLFTAKRILDLEDPRLKDGLEKGDPCLVDKIARAAQEFIKERCGLEISKNNFSFATKFCHWAYWYAYDHKENKFCIYDNVVADVLPYYLRFYTDVEPDRYCKISHTEDADTVVSTIDKCKASYKKI